MTLTKNLAGCRCLQTLSGTSAPLASSCAACCDRYLTAIKQPRSSNLYSGSHTLATVTFCGSSPSMARKWIRSLLDPWSSPPCSNDIRIHCQPWCISRTWSSSFALSMRFCMWARMFGTPGTWILQVDTVLDCCCKIILGKHKCSMLDLHSAFKFTAPKKKYSYSIYTILHLYHSISALTA